MPKEGKLPLTKYAPPPSRLPIYQRVDPREVSFFGRTNYEAALEEKRFIFGIKRADRIRHMYLIGKAGMGKSKLLELLMRQDIAYGHGFCLISQDDELIESLLDFIPEERADDVVIFDLADTEWPIPFNPFANIPPEQHHRFVEDMVLLFQDRFAEDWSRHLERVIRMLIRALFDYPEPTMRSMLLMLTKAKYREAVIASIKDDTVRHFWTAEYPHWVERFDAEVIIPLRNELEHLLSDPCLKYIFAGKQSILDMIDVVTSGKIVCVSLSKTRISDKNAKFLGSLILLKLREARTERKYARKPFYLYLDEFPKLHAGIVEAFLTEAGRLNIACVLAHQYAAQLVPSLQAALLGHVGTIIVFRVGGGDATILEKEMAPVFTAKDMMNLGEREFYIKMIIDGNTYDPFSAEALRVLPSEHDSLKEAIIAASRRRYAASRESLEKLMERVEYTSPLGAPPGELEFRS